MKGIVVGIDCSPLAEVPLRWALREAALRSVPLTVVHAWSSEGCDPRGSDSSADVACEAARVLVTRVQREEEPVDVYLDVAEGRPADILVRRSASADLLVVGTRGLDTLAGALLGSVSQRCVTQATCPVVVVRGDDVDERESIEVLERLPRAEAASGPRWDTPLE
jgi:nucleotide-binding universal stress UspA family protein